MEIPRRHGDHPLTRARSTVTARAGLVVLLVVVLLVPGAGLGAKASVPVRSGTIVGPNPTMVFLGPPSCQGTPNCTAWLASGCDPRLAGQDPGLHASIVDVSELAGSRRRLEGADGWLSGVTQFWSSTCGQLTFVQWGPQPGVVVIPVNAHWMTIAAGAMPLYQWKLW
jgi:hypothetical protein